MSRKFIVGTKNSISAYVADNDLDKDLVIEITSVTQARKELSGRYPDFSDQVVITYGFKTLPASQSLGISDLLLSNGFTRNYWRYVA